MPSATMNQKPRIVELATIVSEMVAKVDRLTSDQEGTWPSFDEDGPVSFPKEVEALKEAILGIMAIFLFAM